MEMSELRLTPMAESHIDEVEQMCVVKPIRFKGPNDKKTKAIFPGDAENPVKISVGGPAKKDMYYQLKICYPADYAKVCEAFQLGIKPTVAGGPDGTDVLINTQKKAAAEQKKAAAEQKAT